MRNTRLIIGVVGFIGSGKDTVGTILEDEFNFEKESFAKPLKDAAAAIFSWRRDLLEGDTDEGRRWREEEDVYWSAKLGRKVTPRWVLQKLGTEGGRNVFGDDLWSASLAARIYNRAEHMDKPPTSYVITDCRFDNEIKAIRSLGGVVIRVVRGEEPRWWPEALEARTKGLQEIPSGIHYSEWAWCHAKFDHVIDNNGTLDDLKQSVHHLVVSLRNS